MSRRRRSLSIPNLIIAASLLLISCVSGIENKQTIKIGGRYQLDLPSSYTENNELSEEATLQYQNTFKDIYVAVIDEKRSIFEDRPEGDTRYDGYTPDLEGYSNLLAESMRMKLGLETLPEMQDVKIKGLNAKVLSFNGYSDGYALYWKTAFIEGRKRYYQINLWTKEEDRDLHESEMTEIINSFREIDKSKY